MRQTRNEEIKKLKKQRFPFLFQILEARLYNGYDSYREYYKARVNGVYSMASKMTEQSNEKKDIQKAKYSEGNIKKAKQYILKKLMQLCFRY